MDFSVSILIPVYNVEILNLVNSIHQGCTKGGFLFEILVFDDASTTVIQEKNAKIRLLPNVVYRKLPINLGRTKIRNLLAKNAQYDFLLFLDCDVMPVLESFGTTLLAYPVSIYNVIIGGTNYEKSPPSAQNKRLHWWVGQNREQKSAVLRNKNPFGSFTLNNMLISKKTYLSILLNEKITQYGHEDSLFGQELKQKKVKLLHLDNPVYHLGLNDSVVFLEKTKQAVGNLVDQVVASKLTEEIKLYSAYLKLERFGLLAIYRWVYFIFSKVIYRNLISRTPSLLFFDLYKLYEFEIAMRKYQRLK